MKKRTPPTWSAWGPDANLPGDVGKAGDPPPGGAAGAGAGAGDWKKTLPAELAGDPSLQDIKDVATLAKSFVDTKGLVGRSLQIPNKDATPEQRKAFYDRLHADVPQVVYLPETDAERAAVEEQLWSRLGRPKDEKGYGLDGLELQGQQLDAEDLAKTAKKLGLTKGQFKTFVEGLAAARAEHARTVKGWQDKARAEWGAAYEERLQACAGIARRLKAPEATIAALQRGEVPPEQLAVWYQVATGMGGSGNQVAGQPGGGNGKLTPAEAKAKIAEIQANPAYWRKNSELHETLKARMAELMPLAYPELAER